MKKEWALTKNKALINFSANYCNTKEKVLNSEAFRSVLEHFLRSKNIEYSRTSEFILKHIKSDDSAEIIKHLTKVFKLLVVMKSKELATEFPEFSYVYDDRVAFRRFVEEIYRYWRQIERYAIASEAKGSAGLVSTNFIKSKQDFDDLILLLYRNITNNISMTYPKVYRQVSAGTNAGLVVDDVIWPVPQGYEILESIQFVKTIVLESPFITYPKKNKRDGFFTEIHSNPIISAGINPEHYFCYPVKVGDLIAYTYVNRDFITHGVSLSNLFEFASVEEISGRKPDILYVMGATDNKDNMSNVFYDDETNNMMVGFVAHNELFDYFGYMKKMLLTLHNLVQIKRGFMPIHGAMVNIVLKSGKSTNICILGDSGAGKSESIEAFRSLAEEYISDMTIIFDDMGTFKIDEKTGFVIGYGTEIGAFVRLDDLETGYAFKELDRSIFMNPDKINSRLITPVSTYEEIMEGSKVDIFLYANNYDKLGIGDKAISFFENATDAKEVFIAGKRMAKGTTTETGLTTSFFANPFGPQQMEEACRKIIDEYFDKLFETNIPVGVIKTQLGIDEFERKGPEIAAVELFALLDSKM